MPDKEPLSNEEIMLEQHEKFMRQASESGVPLYLLEYYGEPPVKTQEDDNSKKDI